MPGEAREVFYDQLVRELNQERAATLGRAGAKLQAAIDEALELRARAVDAPEGEREAALAAFRQAYIRYEQARDWFCLHREAVGLLDHRRVNEIYPPPPWLPSS